MRLQVFVYIFTLIDSVLSDKNNPVFFPLPRFWTNTGFCPPGNLTHESIVSSLLSNELKVNLQLIGALPNQAISHIRIHWLLETIRLVEFEKHDIPKFDFTELDRLVWWLDRRDLSLSFELMGNPSEVFTRNQTIAGAIWEDLTFQIGKRYLNRLGPEKMRKWRFETWNEPDLRGYNTLHFDNERYQTYINAVRRGLNAASRRPLKSHYFNLHGPAGLFKSPEKHPLCWQALEKCNENLNECPLDVITFHYKGSGFSHEVADGGAKLVQEIFDKFPNLTNIPVANSEADPISGWSTPRDSQADVRYAVAVVSIVCDHWEAMLNAKAFKNLLYISHDNAFLSYHPHEFSQRTLFAHFRMNNTRPQPYSQFIQKPVYAALGMLGNLGTHASSVYERSNSLRYLITADKSGQTFLSLMAVSDGPPGEQDRFQEWIGLPTMKGNNYSYIVELLEYQNTDPVYVWNFYGSPAFPNSTVREAMRRNQGPELYATGRLANPTLYLDFPIRSPFLIHIRICTDAASPMRRPTSLQLLPLTKKEIIILWKERQHSRRCVVTYQVWFMPSNGTEWREVTAGWHAPFLSFHFAPKDHIIKGSYKVRSVDTFKRFSEFSKPKSYM